jgi:hypothetical protein
MAKNTTATAKTGTATAKTSAIDALVFFVGVQLYRLWKSLDFVSYDSKSRGHKVCGIWAQRQGRYAIANTAQFVLNCFCLFRSKQGFGVMAGKLLKGLDGGSDCVQWGRFIWSSKGQKIVKWFTSEKALCAFLHKEGEKGDAYGFKGLNGCFGDKLSFVSNGTKLVCIKQTNNRLDKGQAAAMRAAFCKAAK